MSRPQDVRSTPARLRGVVPPCITFFDDRGSIDEPRLRRHIDWLIDAQVDGLLVGGTCGEFSALEISERERLAELSIDCAAGRVPVYVGVMHTSTKTGKRLARHAELVGASAVVSVPPYYSSPPEREVLAYFRDLADAVEIPLIVYNNPAASGVSLSVPTLARLAQEGTAGGIKDSHGDPARIPSLRILCPPDTAILYPKTTSASASAASTPNPHSPRSTTTSAAATSPPATIPPRDLAAMSFDHDQEVLRMRRQRRSVELLALILGLSLVAAGCGGDDDEGEQGGAAEQAGDVPKGGTLVLGAEQEPECIDWISSCAGASWGFWTINVNTMPRSFDIVDGDEGWEYAPSILLDGEPELQTDPDQVVTYQIGDDAVWSDGEPITCADYEYTWEQIVNGEDIYDTTGYSNIASVECPSDKEAVVTFETPYSGWKQLFGGQYGIYPSHILEGQNRNAMMADGYDFSGGPWILENWDKGVEVKLVPNDNFWGEQPKLDEVIFTFLADTSSAFQAFRAGEVKAIYPQPQLDAVAEIEAGIPNTKSHFTVETPNTEGLWMNNERFPFDSLAVRQAFAYAIDRAAIVERLFGALEVTEPLNSFNALILGDFGDPEAFADYEQDLDMVDHLMEGDGWAKGSDGIWAKGGQRATIEFKTTAGNARRELTQQIVQEQAGEAGFEITINNREAGDLFGTDLPTGDYQLGLYAQVMYGLDPTLCNLFCSVNVPSEVNDQSGQNWTRTVVDGLDEPLETVDTALDRDEQSAAQAEADAIMADAMVSLPLDPLPNILLWSDDIVGPVGDNPILGPFYNMEKWGVNT